MQDNIWQGEKVRLRAVEPSDWEAFHAFDEADTEMARMAWRIKLPRSTERARGWAQQTSAAEPQNDVYRLAVENREGVVVGSINSHDCDPRNGTFEYGVSIGRQHRRKGYAREAIMLLLTFFFRELRYQKCNVLVYAFNQPSVHLHESLGFQLEGRLRRQVFTQGAYHDGLLYGMIVEEFEARTLSLAGRG